MIIKPTLTTVNVSSVQKPIFKTFFESSAFRNEINFRGELKKDVFEKTKSSDDRAILEADGVLPYFAKIISEDENKTELYFFLRKNVDSSKRSTPEERYRNFSGIEKYDDETLVRILSLKVLGFDKIFEIGEDKRLFDRIATLMEPDENGQVVLKQNGENADDVILKRPLVPDEINELMEHKIGRQLLNENDAGLRNFIEFRDFGLDILNSAIIGASEDMSDRYRMLVNSINQEGGAVLKTPAGSIKNLNTMLSLEEAAILVINGIDSPQRVHNFIDLKDLAGFSSELALYYSSKPTLLKRLFELMNIDNEEDKEDAPAVLIDKNGKETPIPRYLDSDEVIFAIKMNNEKVKNYVNLIDFGLRPEDAAKIVSSTPRYKRFLELTTLDDNGRVVLIKGKAKTYLPRPLTVEEALFVMKNNYVFTNARIAEDLKYYNKINM